MKLIIGIGNPGKEYEQTRHNVGFMVLDRIAKYHNVEFNQKKFNSVYGQLNIHGEKIVLLKPQTFVNLSGNAVISMMNYFKIDIADILVIYDDLALPNAKIRVRAKGSSGGHNGMKSIISHLGSDEFKRIRIGIGDKEQQDQKDYVLGRFSKADKEAIENSLQTLETVAIDLVDKSFSDFMNKYNRE